MLCASTTVNSHTVVSSTPQVPNRLFPVSSLLLPLPQVSSGVSTKFFSRWFLDATPCSYPSLLTCHRIFGSQIMAIKGSHKQWKITHAIICDLVSLTFMSNIKAILKFYVRQMWQGMQQATTNHFLPTTTRKKDWSKKDWLLLKRKRNFLFVGKATACKHAYLTRSIRSQNKLPIWKQFGQTTHLVERTPHQYLYFIALGKYYCESRSKLFPGRHKSVLLWQSY